MYSIRHLNYQQYADNTFQLVFVFSFSDIELPEYLW